ncbi:hypothetical protein CEXT_563701 [Caerostris extrusa]|uniref:Uncharacterized protein n=1 Tax=Caerostris extrusa TaxID=172846 RepID=A0AAV4TAZ3_CAEEX|nr:hypothetical protein CEXT_563701 [Caerostris extrusa]
MSIANVEIANNLLPDIRKPMLILPITDNRSRFILGKILGWVFGVQIWYRTECDRPSRKFKAVRKVKKKHLIDVISLQGSVCPSRVGRATNIRVRGKEVAARICVRPRLLRARDSVTSPDRYTYTLFYLGKTATISGRESQLGIPPSVIH